MKIQMNEKLVRKSDANTLKYKTRKSVNVENRV